MRFTIGSRALIRASAFNPTTKVVITDYNPNVFDAYDNWVPLQVRRFDGQPFQVTVAMRNGALAVNRDRAVWVKQDHVRVLPDLCDQPVHVPQPPVDIWESGMAARERAERVMATQASYFAGSRS